MSHAVVLAVLPGCTVHVPLSVAWVAKVPVPTTVALRFAAVACAAVTVPLTGCVVCQKVPDTGWVAPEPSMRSAPAVVSDIGSLWPVV